MDNRAVIESFDKIAGYPIETWDHNTHYHAFLLRKLPGNRNAALDIGSGLGAFTRRLSRFFTHVDAVDFSPRMAECASLLSLSIPNISYRCADFMMEQYEEHAYDLIASIATFHHLPMREALEKAKRALRPGGRLMILDLVRPQTASDYLYSAAGAVANRILAPFRTQRRPPRLRRAWEEHGSLDHYPTVAEVLQACNGVLPGAVVRRHLYFRYSLLWSKL